ncbi:MAG: ATP-binding protein [Anaeromyxobacter sp.]
MAAAVAERAADGLGGAAAVLLLSQDGRQLEPRALHHADPDRLRRLRALLAWPLAPGEGIVGRAVAEGRAVLLRALTPEEWPVDPDRRALLAADPPTSAAAVPLRVDGRVQGALVVARHEPAGPLGDDDLGFLEELAAHASLAIAHARERQELLAERLRLSTVLESAQVASRAKDEFLAMLSHELRNPLSPIVTALHLMRLHAPEAAPHERAVIERQVTHLVRLVDDLLDVSRVVRGKVRLVRRPVALADVVARAVEQASPLLEERRHALQLEMDEGLWMEVDDHRIAQVIANLLTNAAKYTDPGGRIVLRARAEGSEVRVAVSDTGIGISPALLPHVFDLFVQGERTLDRAPGGLGIGLTIVRSLVDLHGGRVAVESNGNARGSTFTVWLPLAGRAPAPPPAPEPRAAAPADSVSVLVVDDNEDAAELLAEALRARGHRAQVAYDGPSALALLDEVQPRVALLDLGLPVMDGYELARRVRGWAGDRAVGLVAVTGYGQEPDRRASAQAGFDVHLVKPVELDTVCAAVERLARTGAGEEAR